MKFSSKDGLGVEFIHMLGRTWCKTERWHRLHHWQAL